MKTSLENRIDEEDDWDIYKNDDVVGKNWLVGTHSVQNNDSTTMRT